MKVGHIYKTNWGGNCKILMLDDSETFYQPVDENNELIYAKYKTQSYTRTTTDFFKSTSTLLLKSDLTRQEELIHRPDLPLKLNCYKETFWTTDKLETIEDFKQFLDQRKIDYGKLENLYADKIVVIPHGQQSSDKKPVTLENNKGVFEGLELMFNCFNIQQPYVNPDKPYFSRFRLISKGREEKRLTGFGLYRLGIKGNIPSFYLGGYKSLLELEIDSSLIV